MLIERLMQMEGKSPCCEQVVVHEELVHTVEERLPDDEVLYDCLLYTSRCV